VQPEGRRFNWTVSSYELLALANQKYYMENLNEKLTKLEEAVSLLLSQNDSTKAMLYGIATKADENFIKIENRLSNIETRLNSLSAETSTNFTDVGDQLGGIKAEIVKIGPATRYEQHHEDQKKFNIPN